MPPWTAAVGQTSAVTVHRLSTTSAFVVVDLDQAPTADGIVRWARKVLVDSARALARSRTYAWALLEERVSGASAGISAAPDERAAAIAAFVTEVRPRVAAGEWSFDAAKGVAAEDLAALAEVDTRAAIRSQGGPTGTLTDGLLGAGIAAACRAALGGLEGVTVAVEGAGASGPALAEALLSRGARIAAVGTGRGTVSLGSDDDTDEFVAQWVEHGEDLPTARGSELGPDAVLGTECDVLVCGSKVGLVDHGVAASLPQRLLVPCGPLPVTTRGLAVAARRGARVLPDFLTTSGPLLSFRPPPDATATSLLGRAEEHVGGITTEVLAHPEGPFLGACYRAEAFLGTWLDQLPFGRPLP